MNLIRHKIVRVIVSFAVASFLFCPGRADALKPDLKRLRAEILAEKEPVPFLFIREFNPWHNGASVKFFDGELHRIMVHDSPLSQQFEAEILGRLNDPRARAFYILRQYMTVLRRIVLAKKPPSDPYAKLHPNAAAYLLISTNIPETGPMTQINVANLILPQSWAGRNYLEAERTEGDLVYAYILFNDAAQRTFRDLFRDRRLFEGFMGHLGMRLIQGETRGQKRGLDAHLDAHTGPWTNLGYATTWCQNRGYYESWALAHRVLLSQLFPDVFPLFRATELLERDAFLYFADDPWSDSFAPLAGEREAWNTPQAVLRSHHINALFQVRLWNDSRVEDAHRKSVEILASRGSNNLREFFEDWVNLYPEDKEPMGAILREVTHGLTMGEGGDPAAGQSVQDEFFRCMGPDLWISLTEKFGRFDQMNFNGASLVELKTVLNRLAGRLSSTGQYAWFHHQGPKGEDVNLVAQLSEEIFAERAKRCGQFKLDDMLLYIDSFGERNGIGLKNRLPFVWEVLKARWLNEKVYRREKKNLLSIGAYHPERGPNPLYSKPK